MPNISHSNLALYLKSHLFNSAASATRLAEKSPTTDNIVFAQRLLKLKNSVNNPKLRQVVYYDHREMKRSEKYAELFSRVCQTDFNQLNKYSDGLDKSNNYTSVKGLERYGDIQTAIATQVKLKNGTGMPANQIKVDGKEVAIRCQYPKEAYLEQHFKMLMEQKPAVIVVLSSEEDIAKKNLPEYFREGMQKSYGDITVNCRSKVIKSTGKNIETKLGHLLLNHHRMNISDKTNKSDFSVIHVTNWKDRETITSDELKKLADFVKNKVESECDKDPSRAKQPLIHCNAGIGRTGMLTGALLLMDKDNNKSAREVVQGMRATGSARMVQTLEQYKTLVQLEELLKSDS